ncbi:MAG: alpha/beta hydrolase-fold protein [Ignavibacteriaceae bacterium]
MKKILLILPFVLVFIVAAHSQPKINVTIKVKTDNLEEGSAVYVTGNTVKFGNWQPDAIILNKQANGAWLKKFSFLKGEKLEFKITKGSWETEALNDNGSVPGNHKLEILRDTTLEIEVKLWANQIKQKTEGQITGIVQYHLNMKGKGIKPRDVIVWLPPFYFIEPEKRYPVLYMHDGQNIFDPRTSTFKVDWQLDETADSLIRQGLMEEIIIVGIYNTIDRSSEYAENDTGYAYMNFIIDSLKPFIDKNYRTLSRRRNTATGGSSLAGLISFMLAWEHSDIFSMTACLSPALKIRRYNFVDNVSSFCGQKKDIKIYIDNGDNKLDDSLQTGVDEMLNELKLQGFKEGNDLYGQTKEEVYFSFFSKC